jgi:hypothetical protein
MATARAPLRLLPPTPAVGDTPHPTEDVWETLQAALPHPAPTYPLEDRERASWTLVQISGGLRVGGRFGPEWRGLWAVLSGDGHAWVSRVSYGDAERTVRAWLQHPPRYACP